MALHRSGDCFPIIRGGKKSTVDITIINEKENRAGQIIDLPCSIYNKPVKLQKKGLFLKPFVPPEQEEQSRVLARLPSYSLASLRLQQGKKEESLQLCVYALRWRRQANGRGDKRN
ncbi:hypothetical protein HMPREF1141_1681 [Clostridium sp. MSTE9]|nr:hypothetical protein HMPREF1141_1681 [Clostridium sp. MSTE9]